MEKSNDMDIDSAWENFLEEGCILDDDKFLSSINSDDENIKNENIPKVSDIYISTKTKIAYLSHEIDLHSVFWKINILDYHKPEEGVIKKQMKFNLNSSEELDSMKSKLLNLKNVDEYIITQIVNH